MGKRGPKETKVYEPYGNIGIDEQFFYSHLTDGENGCLNWTGGTHRQGYGMVAAYRYHDRKKIMTVSHRVSMMLHLGRELTRDDYIIHTCGNNLCCNPDHLQITTSGDRDELVKANQRAGITPPPKPQKGRYYRYTPDEVRWIRTSTTDLIAERYNISRDRAAAIRSILRKRTYQWVI